MSPILLMSIWNVFADFFQMMISCGSGWPHHVSESTPCRQQRDRRWVKGWVRGWTRQGVTSCGRRWPHVEGGDLTSSVSQREVSGRETVWDAGSIVLSLSCDRFGASEPPLNIHPWTDSIYDSLDGDVGDLGSSMAKVIFRSKQGIFFRIPHLTLQQSIKL